MWREKVNYSAEQSPPPLLKLCHRAAISAICGVLVLKLAGHMSLTGASSTSGCSFKKRLPWRPWRQAWWRTGHPSTGKALPTTPLWQRAHSVWECQMEETPLVANWASALANQTQTWLDKSWGSLIEMALASSYWTVHQQQQAQAAGSRLETPSHSRHWSSWNWVSGKQSPCEFGRST